MHNDSVDRLFCLIDLKFSHLLQLANLLRTLYYLASYAGFSYEVLLMYDVPLFWKS